MKHTAVDVICCLSQMENVFGEKKNEEEATPRHESSTDETQALRGDCVNCVDLYGLCGLCGLCCPTADWDIVYVIDAARGPLIIQLPNSIIPPHPPDKTTRIDNRHVYYHYYYHYIL